MNSISSSRNDGQHLTQVEVLAVHYDQIERYGGLHGVRDMGLLESALFRPQTGYYGKMIIHLAQAESVTQAQDASRSDGIPAGAKALVI